MKRVQVVKIEMKKEKTLMVESTLNSPLIVAKLVKEFIGDVDRETFVIIALDSKNKINAINMASIGTVNATIVEPREIFKFAILSNAVGIIIAHNHPSGDTKPSKQDIKTTERIVKAAEIMRIPVVDHIIVGDEAENYFSFAANRMLKI